MTTPNYDINYNDKRFADVKSAESAALSEIEKTYSGMTNQSDAYYQDQIQAAKQWEIEQQKQQNAQTDFAISEIEQQKAQAQKDYTKEQSGAYVDWQKQSNQYGANAEQMAAQGMVGTGYAESSQVSMYNTYQYRVTAARESFQRAVQGYNNAITQARLQNNAALAKIAYETLQKTLELSLQGFQYKNQLLLDLADKKTAIRQDYYNRYQDVLEQINKENALAEEVRQYNEKMAEEKRQFNAQQSLNEQQLQLQKDQFAWQKEQAAAKAASASISKSSGSKSSGSSKSSSSKSSGGSVKKGSGGGISNLDGTKKKVTNTNSTPTVDMASVMALGRGAMSAKQLNSLVKQGKVTEYQEGNKLKYKWSSKYIAKSMYINMR